MFNKYTELLDQICKIENNFEKLSFLTSLIRSILQVAAISSLEIANKYTISDEIGIQDFLCRFDAPSDGLPREILEILVPLIRSDYDLEYLNGWFESTKSDVPLAKKVLEWTEFRNKRAGHGVTDITLAEEWVDKEIFLIKLMLSVFEKILPLHNENTLSHYSNLKISIPFFINESPIVILSIKSKKGIWKLKGQYLSLLNADEFTQELSNDNIFINKTDKKSRSYELEEVVTKNGEELIYHNLPIRQTDIFEGRVEEINKIKEWLSEGDARLCLIYGDGGYGKTTLVLEALNQLKEGNLDLNRKLPFVICFYSAKKTKWTENGLIYLRSAEPIIDECIRELARSQKTISKEWFTTSGTALIDKVKGLLVENKLSRDDVLLIIDNTETLATSMAESRALAESLNKISKLLARVIVTSRRREEIAAEPIAVIGLSETESIALLKRLAKEYNAKPLNQAGESKLRKIADQLMHKPLLITAFVKYMSYSNVSIDAALEKYIAQSDEELLEFLYEDAWLRMNDLQKSVFFILVNIDYPINNDVVKRACQLIKINISEFTQALEETHFSNITDYGDRYILEIENLAKKFFVQKFLKFNDSFRQSILESTKKVEIYIKEKEEVEKAFRNDRVTEAFRSSAAKAAKIYVDKGEIDNAIIMYEIAIQDDPLNSYLYDRFSWLILNRTNKFGYALELSKRAVELDSNNIDAIVGLALANYRCGDIETGDKYIDLSISKGRSKSFGFLRKAIARFHKANRTKVLEEKLNLYRECQTLLKIAEKSSLSKHSYDAKNKEDIIKYKELTLGKINKIRLG